MTRTLTLALVAFEASSLCAQEPYPTFCSTDEIPVSLAAQQVLGVAQHSFASGRYAAGSLTVRNLSGRPIRELTLLVEYADKDAKPLLVLTYQAATEDAFESLQSTGHSIRAYYVDELPEEIFPQHSFRLMAFNAATVTDCPRTAKITFVHLRFSDRSTYEWESKSWRTEAVLKDSPPYLTFASPPEPSAFELFFKLRIDREGHVSAIELMNQKTLRIPAAIAENLSQWRFSPALETGNAVPAELVIILQFYRDATAQGRIVLQSRVGLPSKFALVELFPQDPSRGIWRAFFGGFPASRTWIKRSEKK